MNYYIAISGNNGSGKTTISELLCNHFNFNYIPSNRIEFNFLNKFFQNPERWFFETQISFLVSKASEIVQEFEKGSNIVVDRSLIEDINIFANYWIELYNFDSDIINLYNVTSEYICSRIPKPNLIIYCNLNVNECKKRIKKRGTRDFEKLYSKDYLNELQTKYDSFLDEYCKDTPTIIVDTWENDLRTNSIIKKFVNEIKNLISNENDNLFQLSILDENIRDNHEYEIIKIYSNNKPIHKMKSLSEKKYSYKPQIYIAAPFTAFAKEEYDDNTLFPVKDYGEISEEYKNSLLSLDKYLKSLGFSTILPHRDVNSWGKKRLTSSEVIRGIEKSINSSDYILAIPSNSIGVHLEIGYAMAQRKKIIIIECKELESSFFLPGFKEYNLAKSIKTDSLELIVDTLKETKIIGFFN